jgi:hypothetical protein
MPPKKAAPKPPPGKPEGASASAAAAAAMFDDPDVASLRRILVRLNNASYLLQQQEAYALAKVLRLGGSILPIVAAQRGAIPILTGMLLDQRAGAASNAAYALGLIARNCPENQVGINAAGALPFLVVLLKRDVTHVQYRTLGAIQHLAQDSPTNAEALHQLGCVPLVLALLQAATSSWNIRTACAAVIGAIGGSCAAARLQILDSDFLATFSDMMFACNRPVVRGWVKDCMIALGLQWSMLDPREVVEEEEEEVYVNPDALDATSDGAAFAGGGTFHMSSAAGDDADDEDRAGRAGAGAATLMDAVALAKARLARRAAATEAADTLKHRPKGSEEDDGFFAADNDY